MGTVPQMQQVHRSREPDFALRDGNHSGRRISNTIDFGLYPPVIRLIANWLPSLTLVVFVATLLALGNSWKPFSVTLSALATATVTALLLRSLNLRFNATMVRLVTTDIIDKSSPRWACGSAENEVDDSGLRINGENPWNNNARMGTIDNDASYDVKAFLAPLPRAFNVASVVGGMLLVLLNNGSLDTRMRVWNFAWVFTGNFTVEPHGIDGTSFKNFYYQFQLTFFFITALMGVLAGRLAVIAVTLYRLGRRFEFNVQPWHPDRSGGLKPLGDICFTCAAVTVIPSTFLAIWNFMPVSLTSQVAQYRNFEATSSLLLAISIALTIGIFVLPLYHIHRLMARRKAVLEQRLEVLCHQMDEVMKQLFEQEDALEPRRLEAVNRRLASLEETYKRNNRLFTWPFDRATIGKVFLVQVPPVLSFVWGIVRSDA